MLPEFIKSLLIGAMLLCVLVDVATDNLTSISELKAGNDRVVISIICSFDDGGTFGFGFRRLVSLSISRKGIG